jgi:hypothetical protein
MTPYPCSDECVVYAICKQKLIGQKFHDCSIYADHIISSIDHAQERTDKKEGKGRISVMAILPDGEDHYIDRQGVTTKKGMKRRI